MKIFYDTSQIARQRSPNPPRHGKVWTSDDIVDLVRCIAEDKNLGELAQGLERQPDAVVSKALSLDLLRIDCYTNFRTNYGSNTHFLSERMVYLRGLSAEERNEFTALMRMKAPVTAGGVGACIRQFKDRQSKSKPDFDFSGYPAETVGFIAKLRESKQENT